MASFSRLWCSRCCASRARALLAVPACLAATAWSLAARASVSARMALNRMVSAPSRTSRSCLPTWGGAQPVSVPVAATHVYQRPIRQAAHVNRVRLGDCGERIVPGGAHLGGVAGGLRADHVMAVLDAVQLTVGADLVGAVLPVQAVHRVLGHRPQCLERPGWRSLHRVFAESFGPRVHRLSKSGFVGRYLGVSKLAWPVGPGSLRQRNQRFNDLPHARIQDGGDAAGICQGPGVDCCPYHLPRVEPGHLGGA